MPVTAHDVADELRRRSPQIGGKKLHKLLYYIQGEHLARVGAPAFSDRIAAWAMGPVVPDLWADEKYNRPRPPRGSLSEEHLRSIANVVDRYGHLTGAQLEAMSHREDPWADARQDAGDTIAPDAIRTWFRSVEVHRERSDQRRRGGLSPSMRSAVAHALANDPISDQHLA